jgi:hypothetical protein
MRNKSILTLLIILICSVTPTHAAEIWVEPAYLEVSESANFTVDIKVDPKGEEVMGAQYFLYFNNTMLNATEQVEGYFLSHDGTDTWVTKHINNTIGVIEYGEMRLGVEYGVNDPGVLASITFDAIGECGVCELLLTDVVLSDVNATGIPDVNVSNGSVEIKSGICGDVDGKNGITIGDGIQVAMSAIYGTDKYPLTNPWAADVDCKNGVTIGDGIQIAMSAIYGTDKYPLECCG